MRLRLGRARADGGPGNQVGGVLRDNRVEKFGGGGQSHPGNFEEQAPSFFQAGLDIISSVQMRIVDKPFPADGRPRFFEIDAHDDFHLFRDFLLQGSQLRCVFERSVRIMNGTRTDDNQQALVLLLQDSGNAFPTGDNGLVRCFGHRQLRFETARRDQPHRLFDVQILCREQV
jgi:hypothetical protein